MAFSHTPESLYKYLKPVKFVICGGGQAEEMSAPRREAHSSLSVSEWGGMSEI